MRFYRLFKLNADGHIVGVCEWVCADDAQVLGAAMDLLAAEREAVTGIEAWRGATMIVKLARD